MKRRYWVISPNVENDGKADSWLKRSLDERKVFVGYDRDKKHGSTFEYTIDINDCVIIAKGAKDDRKLYTAGLVTSPRKYDEEGEVFYRKVDYLIDEKDFEIQSIELNSDNAYGESSNPGTIYELKKNNKFDKLVIDKIDTIIQLKLNMKTIQERIELLKYKKQIILQGPPGTGKTRLAQQIAKEITRESIIKSPLDEINDFLKAVRPASLEKLEKRKRLEGYLKEFQQLFKKDTIGSLSLDRYSFGNGTNDSFCWWIEYGLYELGGYTGQAGKFKIYWKKSSDAYSKMGFIKDVDDDNEAMKLLAEQLDNVVNERNLDQASEKLSKGFILKILHSYYPDKYFPINNEKCINNALKLLGQQVDGLNIFEKNMALQSAFVEKQKEFNADITNYEFMSHLFTSFDMKGVINIQKEGLVLKGEYKILQFHPAYSYEDFVRGITAETNKNGQVEYKVVNKILADFAQKALDNRSAKYILIIDEINRANLPAVLGELIYALEYRYDESNIDETTVESMYALKLDKEDEEGDKTLKLPTNLYIIGTMNTADRSVGHIDYAIRRRFAFVEVLPEIEPVHPLVEDIFKEVSKLFIHDFEEYDKTKKIISNNLFSIYIY